MSLPPEQEAAYIAIIDSILAASDLNTISAKRIRKGLQAAVDYDITPQKDQITQLIMARFDKFNSDANGGTETTPMVAEPAPTAVPTSATPPVVNGVKPVKKVVSDPSTAAPSPPPKKRASDSETPDESDLSPVEDSPPKKKPKSKHRSTGSVEDDAAFAARLQAEEARQARPTRGSGGAAPGGRKATKPRKGATGKGERGAKRKKAKSATRVGGDEDSDIEDGESRTVNRSGGFHKPMSLSPPLAELLGQTQLSRPQTVKQIWAYVKERDLQDPNDKRQIRCDEPMRAVFKTDRVHMFTMNKILNQNLYAIDE